jgi:nicotinamidase-related amidase
MTVTVDAQPYPWPYDGTLARERLALVIAGAQPAWARRSVGADTAAALIGKVAAAVRGGGGLVVHVRHTGSSASPSGLPPARTLPDEWALNDDPAAEDLVVDAAGVDGFYGSALDRELRRRGIDTLVLCGYGAETAVSSTLRSANDRGYECLTLTDASAPFDATLGAHNLSSVTMSGGIFGAIASSEALLEALP